MSASGGLKGWHVLAILLAFFGAIIAVNGVFVAEAMRTFPGEDEAKSYAQGLHYNETLKRRDAQEALGWRAEASLSPTSSGAASVRIRIMDHAGGPIDGARIEGVLRRPTNARLDHALAFAAMGGGAYVAQADNLPTGHWILHATAVRDGVHFDMRKALLWRTPDS